jgi:hypothetical protein
LIPAGSKFRSRRAQNDARELEWLDRHRPDRAYVCELRSGCSLVDADRYNQLITRHGTTMLFLFAVPVMETVGVYWCG